MERLEHSAQGRLSTIVALLKAIDFNNVISIYKLNFYLF